MRELARWHFGGGAEYCEACSSPCAECPYTLHAPETDAGKTAWNVLRACAGQVRATHKGAYGLDFGSVLALGSAMGADLGTLAEVLPTVEVTLVRAYQQEADDADSSN